jgi:uncharacterized phiE125 gp8 family phage protein
MPLILIGEPEEEPLSLADAKLFLRIDHTADDALIADLIRAARKHVETVTGKRLVTQAWRLVLDQWPEGGVLKLPLAPVSAVEAARLRAPDGAETAVDTAAWLLDTSTSRLRMPERPPVLRPFAGIEIDLEAGYGAAADVPPGFVQAIRLLVAHWYEHRASALPEGMDALPLAVAALIAPERGLRI